MLTVFNIQTNYLIVIFNFTKEGFLRKQACLHVDKHKEESKQEQLARVSNMIFLCLEHKPGLLINGSDYTCHKTLL